MSFLLPFIYFILFTALLYNWSFFKTTGLSFNKLFLFFVFKLIASVCFWYIETIYLGHSDALSFFEAGKKLNELFKNDTINGIKLFFGFYDKPSIELSQSIVGWNASFENNLYNDSRTMIRINSIIYFLSFGNVYVHTLFLSFASFIGLSALYKSLTTYFHPTKYFLTWVIYFTPSVMYWSSGNLKESILILGIGTTLYGCNWGLDFSFNKNKLSAFLVGIICLASVKIYVLLIMIPAVIVNILINRKNSLSILKSYLLIYGSLFFLVWIVYLFYPSINPVRIIKDKRTKAISSSKGGYFMANNQHFVCVNFSDSLQLEHFKSGEIKIKDGSQYLKWERNNMTDTIFVTHSKDTATYAMLYVQTPANTRLNMPNLYANLFSLIKNIPFSIYHSTIRPCFIYPKNVLEVTVFIETAAITILVLLCFFYFKKPTKTQIILIASSIVIAINILILAGSTTPVLGALIRYRMPALLFLLIGILPLIDFKKIITKKSPNN